MEYCNINTNITKKNHDELMELITKTDKLLSMNVNKASITDIALSNLFEDLNNTEHNLDYYAVKHLNRINGDAL